ncbi:hypothetical protein [Candidatus Stoquefichus sp. SB1]|uniref:hypothetical protein n=1 Tax=Candidatus Stoquefichus sp. SB1 TaxID=1658109 RepID=UPI00067F45E6|nr:hypothetical protein [Candidatus Stoquefichus sp. SB1]
MTKEEAVLKAHHMYAYETSEQSDLENHDFDALWQSIYDVCQLATYGILDDLSEEELKEAMDWLTQTQSLTENYQNTQIYF